METLAPSSLFFLVFFLFPSAHAIPSSYCSISYCQPWTEPSVRFPFRLTDRQPSWCGFSGYNLSCDSTNNQTILNLPSGNVTVKNISYSEQYLTIDPQFCGPNGIRGFDIHGTPFYRQTSLTVYNFFNCSPPYPAWSVRPLVLPCLSGVNHTVFALTNVYNSEPGLRSPSCRLISSILVPTRSLETTLLNNIDEFELQWFMPECIVCEGEGGTCGTLADAPDNVICFQEDDHKHSQGLSATAHGLLVGISVVFCIIGLVFFTCKKARDRNRPSTTDISSNAITPQLPTHSRGLDGSSIESYPKTVIGESGRLLKAGDGSCPICLSDYQPNEELRTIPDCAHYFHAKCVDKWLKMHATCPLCRSTLESTFISMSASISSQTTISS